MRAASASLVFLLAATPAAVLRADNLTLTGDARLSGTVLSIQAEGSVQLATMISPEPILLKAGAVDKVEFSVPESTGNTPDALIELVNGDILPADVEGLDGDNLQVSNPDAGRFSIPRTAVKSMQLGIHKRGPLYTGPRDLAEWTTEPGSAKNWRFANNTLIASGSATASKVFELPVKFVIKFNVRWQANPNLRVYFADPLVPEGGPVDRYCLQLSGAGVGILRESSQGKREQTVISPLRGPEQFPTNQMDIEVQVDRKSNRILLYLNGEREGAGVDPVDNRPEGNGITIVSSATAGLTQEVRAIEVRELDNSRTRHLSEDRGDTRTDSLISREEERWGGKLLHIRKTPEATLFSFKSDFQDAPLEIPQTEVSTLFFAAAEKPAAVEGNTPFSLKLRGDGVLQVSSCVFSAEAVTARHPLLGDLKFNRAGVVAVEKAHAAEPEKKSE